ncbi:hypothetical protein KM043_012474 [Ampulex compressa]|nr:hypothetical protein KM043_012474 [Ampulex compressa]
MTSDRQAERRYGKLRYTAILVDLTISRRDFIFRSSSFAFWYGREARRGERSSRRGNDLQAEFVPSTVHRDIIWRYLVFGEFSGLILGNAHSVGDAEQAELDW